MNLSYEIQSRFDDRRKTGFGMGSAEHSDVKQTRLTSLDGLKMIAMISVFMSHCILKAFYIDLGARACELLFVISGFLVGLKSFYKPVPATWDQSVRYVLKKLYRFWPLHFITTVLLLIFYYKPFSVGQLYIGLISLSMLQAWSNNPGIYFNCNGSMWFLSALLFCYLLSPKLSKLIKKGKIFSLTAFAVVFLVRFSIDLFKSMYPESLTIDTHVSPIIRCMEYLMGMMMVPCFVYIKECSERFINRNRLILFTLCEFFVWGGGIYLLIRYTNLWKSVYVLAFCPLVFVFALNEGLISKLLSIKPVRWFSIIQLEFYILHQVIIYFTDDVSFVGGVNAWIRGAVVFIIVLIVSTVYHVLLTDRLAGLMRRIIPFRV